MHQAIKALFRTQLHILLINRIIQPYAIEKPKLSNFKEIFFNLLQRGLLYRGII